MLPGSTRELGNVIGKEKQGWWPRRMLSYRPVVLEQAAWPCAPLASRLLLMTISLPLQPPASSRLILPLGLGVSPPPSRRRWAHVPFPLGPGKTRYEVDPEGGEPTRITETTASRAPSAYLPLAACLPAAVSSGASQGLLATRAPGADLVLPRSHRPVMCWPRR